MGDMAQTLFDKLKGNRNDFPSNATMDNLRSWADEIVIDIHNSEESWRQDGKKILEVANRLSITGKHRLAVQILFGGENEEVFVEDATMDADPEEYIFDNYTPDKEHREKPNVQKNVATDVTLNLQYFFPYCDQALRSYSELELILVVICLNVADQQRVSRYLSAMNSVKPRLCIVTAVSKSKTPPANTKISMVGYDTKNIGALLPIFCVSKREKVIPSLNSEGLIDDLSVRKLSFYDKTLCEYQEKRQKTIYTQYPQYNMLLEAGRAAIDGINNLFYGSAPKRKENYEKDVRELEAKIRELETSGGNSEGKRKK